MKSIFIICFAFLIAIGAIGTDLPNSNSSNVDHVEERFVKTDDGSTSTLTDDHLPERFSSGFLSYLDNISLNHSASNGSRSKRDADALSEYSNKLSTVARISNGISLTAGLNNGNIPIDAVIGELLNLGDVNVAEFVGFKTEKLADLIAELAKTPESLDTSTDADKFVNGLERIIEIKKKYQSVGDFTTYEFPTGYFDLVDNFDPTSADIGVLSLLLERVNKAVEKIEKLENDPEVANLGYIEVDANMKILRVILKEVGEKASKSKFANFVKTLDGQKKLSDPEDLKPLEQMIFILNTFDLSAPVRTEFEKFSKNLDVTTSLSTKLGASKADLVFLEKLTSRMSSRIPQKRQHSFAFPNGASDLKLLVKDIRDPTLDQTLGAGKNFSRLSGGLKPLMTMSGHLESLEAKLTPISNPQAAQSTKEALLLQLSMPGSEVTSKDVSEAITAYSMCTFGTNPKQTITDVGNVMKDVGELGKILKTMRLVAESWPPAPAVVTDVQKLLAELPDSATQENVVDMLAKLKVASAKVAEVKKFLTGVQEHMKGVATTDKLTAIVTNIKGARNNVQTLLDDAAVKKTSEGLNCVSAMEGKIEDIEKVTGAIRIIRDFEAADFTNIRSAIDTVSQAAGSLNALRSTPADMKKKMTDDVKELVEMKDSQKTSAILGPVAWSISNMDKLRSLEATVTSLKSNGAKAIREIAQMRDQKLKTEVQKMWGDHKKFIDSLEASLKMIEAFKSKLTVPKDLRQLGTPLEAAQSVQDVVGSVPEKLEALAMLISQTNDTNVKTELQGIKDHLDKLLPLDLQFSSHLSAAKDVPTALNSLFGFLDVFLTPGVNANNAFGSIDLEEIGMWFGVSAASILVPGLLIGVLAYFLYHRRKKWPSILEWFTRPESRSDLDMANLATGILLELNREEESKKTGSMSLVESKSKSAIGVPNSTRVKLPDGRWIDATRIKTLDGIVFIAAAGPMEEDQDGTKEDTRGDLLYMACVNKSEFIVQLCPFEEEREKIYASDPTVMESSAARYYEDAVGGLMDVPGYDVETTTLGTISKKEVEVRTLVITSEDKKKTHTLTHVRLTTWKDKTGPENSQTIVDMMSLVNESKKPIIVHCSDGVGRTLAFIGSEIIARYVERYPWKQTSAPYRLIRKMRAPGIQAASHILLSFIVAYRLLLNKYQTPATDKHHYKLESCYDTVRARLDRDELNMRRALREAARAEKAIRRRNAKMNYTPAPAGTVMGGTFMTFEDLEKKY